jgi:hypothetical protein
MLRHVAAFGLTVGLLGMTPALAQGVRAPAQDSGLRGEWRRAGPTFVCQVTSANKLQSPTPDQLIHACQRMGSISIGISEAALTAALGQPHRKLPQPDNAKAYVYFLGQQGQPPYFIAVTKAGRAVALQASGETPTPASSFSQINLGDSTEKLRSQFGAVFNVEPSGLPDTDLWSYGVWPFTFEVKNDRVTSIRITESTDKPAR